MTKNNQYKNLIDPWKGFSNAGLGGRGGEGGGRDGLSSCKLKNKKLDLWVRLWNLTPSYNLRPLGRCNSELLKKSKSSRSQIIFEINSFKNFAKFTGKHLFWGLFLIKLQAFRPATFLKRTPTQVFPVDFVNFLRTAFL